MFVNLVVLFGLIGAPPAPRTAPPGNRIIAPRGGGSPYQCMVEIEFVNGEPVLGLVCGL